MKKKIEYKEDGLQPSTFFYCEWTKERTPFYNSPDYKILLHNGKHHIPLPPNMENLFIRFLLFRGVEWFNKNSRIKLRSMYQVTIPEEDSFIEQFLEQHPVEKFDGPYEVPLYAINGEYTFHVGTISEDITISEKHERELTNEAIKLDERQRIKYATRWFYSYFNDRSLPCNGEYAEECAIRFLSSKGIDYKMRVSKREIRESIGDIPNALTRVGALIIVLVLLGCLMQSC